MVDETLSQRNRIEIMNKELKKGLKVVELVVVCKKNSMTFENGCTESGGVQMTKKKRIRYLWYDISGVGMTRE